MAVEIMDIPRIMEILPYRYPMLLVDRAWIPEAGKCVGFKNLSSNEEFFQGHFPTHPIFPGVLQVEAMKQVAEIAVKPQLDPDGCRDIYIKALGKVKFRRPNHPGDRMLIETEVLSLENGEAKIKALTRNNSGVTCQADMTMSVRDHAVPSGKLEAFGEFDKNEAIAMDGEAIKALIPHRYPFLLVDYIVRAEGEQVLAVKNVTYNEPFFQGHTPSHPVMPGAIQSEIIAQAGCVHMLSRPGNKGKMAFFMSIEGAVFHHPILPGDQLVIEVELPETSSRFGQGSGRLLVDGRTVSESAMKFVLVDP